MTRKWFQIHLSTAIVLMFVAAFSLAVIVAAWKDVDEFRNFPHIERYYSAQLWQRYRHAENVLFYGPPIAFILVVTSGAALELNIRRREARKP
jgi:hypothetical protein